MAALVRTNEYVIGPEDGANVVSLSGGFDLATKTIKGMAIDKPATGTDTGAIVLGYPISTGSSYTYYGGTSPVTKYYVITKIEYYDDGSVIRYYKWV